MSDTPTDVMRMRRVMRVIEVTTLVTAGLSLILALIRSHWFDAMWIGIVLCWLAIAVMHRSMAEMWCDAAHPEWFEDAQR